MSGEYFIYELPHLVILKMSNQRSLDDAYKRLLIPCGRTISSTKILFLFFSLISSSLSYIIKNNIYFSLFLFTLYLFLFYNIFQYKPLSFPEMGLGLMHSCELHFLSTSSNNLESRT